MTVPERFSALIARRQNGEVERSVGELTGRELPDGDVTIRVERSSVNYKDALATVPHGGVARVDELVPGIDLAGEVVESGAAGVEPGRRVIAHGYTLGVDRHGGFAQFARVPGDWIVPLPEGLDVDAAMAIGTAGFTAGMAIDELQRRGIEPGSGPILVTGATGGVGIAAVKMLAGLRYTVVASTGKKQDELLMELGASEVVGREETSAAAARPLEKQRWAGAIDPVGGATLAYILRTLRHGGTVANCGLTGGTALIGTVLPFVLRGVAVIGIDSAELAIDRRRALWQWIADELDHDLGEVTTTVALDEVEGVLDRILRGEVVGRTVVNPSA